MIRRSFIVCCVAALAAMPALASEWTFAGWYGGGCYPNIAFDPRDPKVLYLTSDVNGIWKSSDGGETWESSGTGLGQLMVSVLEVAPSDPKTLYAGTKKGLYVSVDAARTWRIADGPAREFSFSRPESYRSILIHPVDPNQVLVGTAAGEIWQTKDGGAIWRRLGRPFGRDGIVTAMIWMDDEMGVFLVASANGLAQGHLGEASPAWKILPPFSYEVTDLYREGSRIWAATEKGLFVSDDEGTGWRLLGEAPQGRWFRLGANDDRLMGAWNDGWKGGVAVSEDAGSSWKIVKAKMLPDREADPTREWAGSNGRINALKRGPKSGEWWRTDWWGVWKSIDDGKTWTEKIRGAANTVTSDVLVAANGDLLVATMDNGLLRSRDQGASYETLFPKRYEDDRAGHVWRVLQKKDGSFLATSSPWNRDHEQVAEIMPDGSSRIHRAGLPASRSRKNTVWHYGYAKALAADPRDPSVFYLGMDGDDAGGFFISKDGGREWKRPRNQPGSLKIYNGLAADPVRPGRILWGASGARGGVYLSEDGGESWSYVQRRMKKVYDLAFGPDGRAWAAGEMKGPALFVSEDGGRRWKAAKFFGGDGAAEALCFLPDGRLALGISRWNGRVRGGIYLSSPDHLRWERIDAGLPEGDAPSSIAFDADRKVLYVALYAGSVYKRTLE